MIAINLRRVYFLGTSQMTDADVGAVWFESVTIRMKKFL